MVPTSEASTALEAQYDVVVVGGGPVGCVTAAALGRAGARVLVVEADPNAASRLAGEWLHPPALEVLDRLRLGRLDGAEPRTGYGFAIFPDDRSPEIELPYPDGTAAAAEHARIVASLRAALARVPSVTFLSRARVTALDLAVADGGRVRIEERDGRVHEVIAGAVVGADGKQSVVRAALGFPDGSSMISTMAGVELEVPELPREGFGHVLLGGPGPALLYRIDPRHVRACLEVPLADRAGARAPYLLERYHDVFPESLREPLREALARRPLAWAGIRFRPRALFGREARVPVALVGDACGHTHPMTAIGMTQGFLDAEALASSGFLGADRGWLSRYSEERGAPIPEILSNALYHCFRRADPAAREVRRAMFRTLRESPRERARTMQILGVQDRHRRSFSSAFMRIALRAMRDSATSTARESGLRAVPGRLLAFGEWMQWPTAAVVPSAVSSLYRAQTTAERPLPPLAIGPGAARPGERATGATSMSPRAPGGQARSHAGEVQRALEHASEALLAELEGVARRLGTTPDAELVEPSMTIMRAITAAPMRPGMAARMTLGRRRLATEGVPRALRAETDTRGLAGLLLVLFDGAAWREERVADLDVAVHHLLAAEAVGGGFARHRGETPDLEATTLTLEALAALRGRVTGSDDASLAPIRGRAAAQLARALSACPAPDARTLSLTARGLSAANERGEAATVLLDALTSLSVEAIHGAGVREHASVLAGLSALSAPRSEGMDAHVAALVAALTNVHALPWETLADATLALAWHEARLRSGELAPSLPVARTLPRAETPPAKPALVVAPAPEPRSEPAAPSIDPADWAACREALEQVSRTFAQPIAFLPEELRVAVTLGYLFCRIADTIEDHPDMHAEHRPEMFARFLSMVEACGAPATTRGPDTTELRALFAKISGGPDDAELALARNLDVAIRVFLTLRPAVREIVARWVTEMARGMDLYTRRAPGADGWNALLTVEDLDRYCYYVAGTVGHMLTDLFVESIGLDPRGELALALREDAESFAEGLQMVNILKDVTDDRERRVSFVPRTVVLRQGLDVEVLADPRVRARAHAAVAPLFDRAEAHLDRALRYALSIPREQVGIRMFCLLPLFMAVRTLVVARGNDAMFVPGAPVKISRDEVGAIIADCLRHAQDDEALRERYASLRQTGPAPTRASA